MSWTYTTLTQAIQDYCENDETEFVAEIPTFVKNAEERILKNVSLSLFRKSSTGNLTTNTKFLATPSDYLSSLSLSVISSGNNVFLIQKDVNWLQDYSPDPTVTGVPKYYAEWDDDTFIVAPTPGSNYSVELHYFYRPSSIVDVSPSWIGTNAPDCLLYGSLFEAYTFMKGEADLLDLYDKRFMEALLSLKNLGEGKQTTDEYRASRVTAPRNS